MASVNNYALVDIPFSHDGTGDGAGDIKITHVYRAGCSHIPVIDLGTGNATHKTLALNTPASGVIAANDAKHTVCVWGANTYASRTVGTQTIDFSNATRITFIDVHTNKLTSLITNGLSLLTKISSSSNSLLRNLDFSTNTELDTFYSAYNRFPDLSISTNTKMKDIRVGYGGISQTTLNNILANLDSFGLSNGTIEVMSQVTGAAINTGTAAATSAQSLKDKGWTITFSGTWVPA